MKTSALDAPRSFRRSAASDLNEYTLFNEGAERFKAAGQSLDLIDRAPHRDLKLAFVVPICKEFENRNLRNLLDCLTKQTAAKELFEVIFIVNNTLDRKATALPENIKAMKCLGAIQDPKAPIPPDMPADYVDLIKRAREAKLAVGFIDLATEGIDELNMGKIRKVGETVAVARLNKTSDGSGICHPLDGDMHLARNTVKNLLQAYNRAGAESVFALYDFAPTGCPEVYKTAAAYDFGKAHHAFERLASRPSTESIVWGGGLHGTRARVIEKTGGVPLSWEGEDEFFHQKLVRHGKYEVAGDVVITIQDRAQPESFMGGSRFRALGGLNKGSYIPRAYIQYANPVYEHAAEQLNSIGNQISAELSETLKRYGIPMDQARAKREGLFEAARKSTLTAEQLMEHASSLGRPYPPPKCNANAFATALYRSFAAGLSEGSKDATLLQRAVHSQTARAAVRQGYSSRLTGKALDVVYSQPAGTKLTADHFSQHPQVKRALERDTWMIEKLMEVRSKKPSATEARALLAKEYPEQVGSYDKNGLRHAAAVLKGLNFFIRAVRRHPEEYRAAAEHLATIGLYQKLGTGMGSMHW